MDGHTLLATIDWAATGWQVLTAAVTAFVIVWILMWRMCRRIDRLDDARDGLRKELQGIRGDLGGHRQDLRDHQRQDCVQLDELQTEVSAVKQGVSTLIEMGRNIEKKLDEDHTEINKRIGEHWDRNIANVDGLRAIVAENSKSLAALGATPQKKKRPPRKKATPKTK